MSLLKIHKFIFIVALSVFAVSTTSMAASRPVCDPNSIRNFLEEVVGHPLTASQIKRLSDSIEQLATLIQDEPTTPTTPPSGNTAGSSENATAAPTESYWRALFCIGGKISLWAGAQVAVCVDRLANAYYVAGLGAGYSLTATGDFGVIAFRVYDDELTGVYAGADIGFALGHGGGGGSYIKLDGASEEGRNFAIRLRYTPGMGVDASAQVLKVGRL